MFLFSSNAFLIICDSKKNHSFLNFSNLNWNYIPELHDFYDQIIVITIQLHSHGS
jgi:hypothetical protein